MPVSKAQYEKVSSAARYVEKVIAEILFDTTDKRAKRRSGDSDLISVIFQVKRDLERTGRKFAPEFDCKASNALKINVCNALGELMDADMIHIEQRRVHRYTGGCHFSPRYMTHRTLRCILEDTLTD